MAQEMLVDSNEALPLNLWGQRLKRTANDCLVTVTEHRVLAVLKYESREWGVNDLRRELNFSMSDLQRLI
jgi:hypothetical protein